MLALFIITYVILNEFNPVFFSKSFFKVALLAFCAVALIASGLMIADDWKR
jgi:hypothetical protein